MTTGNSIFISSDRNRLLAIKKLSDIDLNKYEVKFIKKRDNRTVLQNSALHKYCELLAKELNDSGYDMKSVLTMKTADIPWTTISVKENLWKSIQQAMGKDESTTKQDRQSYSDTYEVLNRFTAEKLGVSVPFPSSESMK